MPLFEITITGSKTFFVEAADENAALEHAVVGDEMTGSIGEFPWEADEGSARLLNESEAERAREREPQLIVD